MTKTIKRLLPAALAVLLGYLKEKQKKGVERLKTVHNYAEAQYMQLSPVTRANLELTETMRGREKKGTLLWVLDKTQTAMGKRLMRAWIEQPLVNVAAINARLDGVEELVRDYITEENGDPETFGNARGVRNIFEHILVAQNNRLAAMETVTKEDLMTLTQDDVLHARGKLD